MTEDSNLAKKLEEKNKFTEDELKQVQTIQQSYANVQNQFGQLKLAQIRLDEQEVELEDALKQIQSEEKKFLDEITKKYGEGTLNPETGEFTPNKSN
jgi:lipid II:glycine glycyltransferase (peptidoglycan interpeptide bridge formation enzyme)|tara:strand:+ start:230 stop:520 length:291 start_codon:yes stop_codon:yes gene_type:complete